MNANEISCLSWKGDGRTGVLGMLDQRLLPTEEVWLTCKSASDVAVGIRDMAVRGAPAIGVAAAYGVVLAAAEAERKGLDERARKQALAAAIEALAATRPTAVNLFWALERCRQQVDAGHLDAAALLTTALQIHRDDAEGNRRIGELGAARIEDGMGVLTHCNAGALATGGFGTALATLFVAHEQGKRIHVYVDETRPRLQGARLTAWELSKVGVPFTLICDNAAASLMGRGKIQLCVTGADRIAANGDTANKVGTYSVAVNAAHHGIPFHVAAPVSTFDLGTPNGQGIVIEERSPDEVTLWGAERTCLQGARVFNPAFDVTPAWLIRSIFCERGEIGPVSEERIRQVVGAPRPPPR